MNKSQKALIQKDIQEITASKQILLPMVIVPLIIMVLLPAGLLLLTQFAGGNSEMLKDLQPLIRKLPVDHSNFTTEQLVIYAALNYAFPSFFLIIPIMASGIIGASSFVGEKEHKTMETLLYTPLTMENLLKAKILGVFIPSFIVTLLSFTAFGIIINIGGFMHFGGIIFPNVKWLIMIFLVAPAVTLLSLTVTVLVSAKSSTFQEAQQTSGLLVIPVVLFMASQMTGLFLVSNNLMAAIGIFLIVLDYFLIKKISSRFVPEKLV